VWLRATVSANTDGKGFVECRSWSLGSSKLSGPRFSQSQLVDYLTTSERSEPDVAQMKSTPLRSIQSLLVAILHDYWLAKYVMHVDAAVPPTVCIDGSGEASGGKGTKTTGRFLAPSKLSRV